MLCDASGVCAARRRGWVQRRPGLHDGKVIYSMLPPTRWHLAQPGHCLPTASTRGLPAPRLRSRPRVAHLHATARRAPSTPRPAARPARTLAMAHPRQPPRPSAHAAPLCGPTPTRTSAPRRMLLPPPPAASRCRCRCQLPPQARHEQPVPRQRPGRPPLAPGAVGPRAANSGHTSAGARQPLPAACRGMRGPGPMAAAAGALRRHQRFGGPW